MNVVVSSCAVLTLSAHADASVGESIVVVTMLDDDDTTLLPTMFTDVAAGDVGAASTDKAMNVRFPHNSCWNNGPPSGRMRMSAWQSWSKTWRFIRLTSHRG